MDLGASPRLWETVASALRQENDQMDSLARILIP